MCEHNVSNYGFLSSYV